jgi:hypothetical protein
MTGDNWKNNCGDDSQCQETGSSWDRCSERLGLKAKLIIYGVVQGGGCEERLLI